MAHEPASSRLIESFLEMIAAERGGAKNTAEAYARDLADYAARLAAPARRLLDASSEDIRAYLKWLERRGLKPTSSARKLSSIRQFHRFLLGEGDTRGQSRRHHRGAPARPGPAEDALDRRGRSPPRSIARGA